MADRPVGREERFDPYYTWLGIPPDESTGGPNCYRLLGLALFEANPQVIENAADRQMMHLRSFQTGIHSADSQRLLNEVAGARIRLLDPGQKAAYDEQLRSKLAPPPSPVQPNVVFAPTHSPADVRLTPPAKSRRSQLNAAPLIALIVLGGIAGLALGGIVVLYITGQRLPDWSAKPRQTADRLPQQPAPPPPFTPEIPKKDESPLQPPVPTPPGEQPESKPDNSKNESQPKPGPRGKKAPPKKTPKAAAAVPAPRAGGEKPADYLFANIPSAWRLPPLISSAAAPLLKLAYEPKEPLTVIIDSAAANIPANARIYAEPDSQNRGWIIFYASDTQSQASTQKLAMIRRQGLQLTFAWAIPFADAQVRSEVTNCLLEVGTAKDSRVVQLREPEALGPIVLDLDKDNQIVEIDLADPPPAGKLSLKIVEISGFDRGGKLRGGTNSLVLGKTAFIEFADMKGAQIELRLMRQSAAGKFHLRVEPVFREGGDKEFDLSLPRLEKFKSSHEGTVSKAQAELPALQKNLSDTQTHLRSLQARRTNNIQEESLRRTQIVAASTAIERLGQRIGKLQKQVADSQARLKAVPDVRTFIQSLHKKATIKYIVYAEVGDKELILVDGQSARPAQISAASTQ